MLNRRSYNVEMIRDFLEHLAWLLRCCINDLDRPAGRPLHPELVEQLAKYLSSYKCVLLHGPPQPVDEELPDFEKEFCRERVKSQYLQFRRNQLETLESLASLFEEALDEASRPLTEAKERTIDLKSPAGGKSLVRKMRNSDRSKGDPSWDTKSK